MPLAARSDVGLLEAPRGGAADHVLVGGVVVDHHVDLIRRPRRGALRSAVFGDLLWCQRAGIVARSLTVAPHQSGQVRCCCPGPGDAAGDPAQPTVADVSQRRTVGEEGFKPWPGARPVGSYYARAAGTTPGMGGTPDVVLTGGPSGVPGTPSGGPPGVPGGTYPRSAGNGAPGASNTFGVSLPVSGYRPTLCHNDLLPTLAMYQYNGERLPGGQLGQLRCDLPAPTGRHVLVPHRCLRRGMSCPSHQFGQRRPGGCGQHQRRMP